MWIAYIALAMAVLSTLLALTGLRTAARDTARAVTTMIGTGPSRAPMLAFATLWILIFWLAVG